MGQNKSSSGGRRPQQPGQPNRQQEQQGGKNRQQEQHGDRSGQMGEDYRSDRGSRNDNR